MMVVSVNTYFNNLFFIPLNTHFNYLKLSFRGIR